MSSPARSSFEHVTTLRPVEVARPGVLDAALAPYLAIEVAAAPSVELALVSGEDRLAVTYAAGGFSLTVTTGPQTTDHRSRRSGRAEADVERVALTLTGTRLAVLAREAGTWVARGFVDLRDRLDTHDEAWLAGVRAEGGDLRGFGQLGLRDVRLVTRADGSPLTRDGVLLLSATCAGPGFFDTAHSSVWSLDPGRAELTHLSDVFFRRPDQAGAYGDHAAHLLRDGDDGGDRWLFATSTWGDFELHHKDATVAATVAETGADLLSGRHLLDTRPLALPTTGLTSVGVWDPQLVRTDDGWLAAYVSARKFFRFHPVVAAGPSLEDLALVGAAPSLKETEGSTLVRRDGRWLLLASDGVGRRYPVWEVAHDGLVALDDLAAPYPSNIPWPTLVDHEGETWLIGFDGEPVGGRIVGYGTHGALHLARRTTPA
ncbi:hypothetical protein GCM10009623_25810 [Nocardioides aestuarii]|uniref:Uncharacterized protein n=1 Tax=Nocardioides aestuarii TaxID=252231 RepID=A0ABW4TM22_9ACTN